MGRPRRGHRLCDALSAAQARCYAVKLLLCESAFPNEVAASSRLCLGGKFRPQDLAIVCKLFVGSAWWQAPKLTELTSYA